MLHEVGFPLDLIREKSTILRHAVRPSAMLLTRLDYQGYLLCYHIYILPHNNENQRVANSCDVARNITWVCHHLWYNTIIPCPGKHRELWVIYSCLKC